jgi:hypothetical protein
MKKQKKNGLKYHFCKYWVKNINILDAILKIDAILVFPDWQQIFIQKNGVSSIIHPKIQTFHPVVPLLKNEFLCKKSALLNFLAILNF